MTKFLKTTICFLVALSLCLTFVACDVNKTDTNTNTNTNTSNNTSSAIDEIEEMPPVNENIFANIDEEELSANKVSGEATLLESKDKNKEGKTDNIKTETTIDTNVKNKDKTDKEPVVKTENKETDDKKKDTESTKSSNTLTPQEPSVIETEVFTAINNERKANGLNELVLNKEFYSLAKTRAIEAQTVFGHTRPNGKMCSTVFADAGINTSDMYVGENLGRKFVTVKSVMSALMKSSTHKANVLNKNFNKVAICVVQDENGVNYLCQLFTS